MLVNNRFKIKTEDGYKKFAGITQSSHKSYLEISFVDRPSVKCSGEHIFWLTDNTQIKAKNILTGFNLKSNIGAFEVKEIYEVETSEMMFDIIEVDSSDNSFLLANELKTHNCQFITFEKTLIETDILDFYKTSAIIDEVNGFTIYKSELDHADGLIIVTIDPSGGGEDNSVIQLWEIAPKQVHEIASLADEDADASVIFEKLLWVQEYMKTKWNYQPSDSLILFERNGIGEGLAQILTQTEKAIENLEIPIFYDGKGKPGLHMTPTIKNKLALQFKNLVEYNKMKINDVYFIDELYGFIRTIGGGYTGKSGYNDDRIMASFLMVYYLLNTFADYATGDFSVDNMMLVSKEDKIVHIDKNLTDPALIYREKMKQEAENAEEKKKADAALIEEAKRREREYYAKQAVMSTSIVEYDEEDEDFDPDEYDILPTMTS